MSQRFPHVPLSPNGELDLQIAYIDVIREGSDLLGRVKAYRPGGDAVQFREPWPALSAALVEHGIVDKQTIPVGDLGKIRSPRDYVQVPVANPYVRIVTKTPPYSNDKAIEIRPRTPPAKDLKSSAEEFAHAVDEAASALKPVMEKQGIPMTASAAVEGGRALLEHKHRAGRRAS